MRINLYGGPCSGKSTLAASIYHKLKIENYSVELIREWIKQWAYEGRKPKSFDQTFVFSNQLYLEDTAIQSGIQHLVTDSPLLMQVCYAKRHKYELWKSLLKHVDAFENKFPSVNIFLDRTGIGYQEAGRYEDESDAIWMDGQMREFLDEHLQNYFVFPTTDFDNILSTVKGFIDA